MSREMSAALNRSLEEKLKALLSTKPNEQFRLWAKANASGNNNGGTSPSSAERKIKRSRGEKVYNRDDAHAFNSKYRRVSPGIQRQMPLMSEEGEA